MTTPTTADLVLPVTGPLLILTFPTNKISDLLSKIRTLRAPTESPTQGGHGVGPYTLFDLVRQRQHLVRVKDA